MSVVTMSRQATVDEIAAEMDRRGVVILDLESERDALRAALEKIAENDTDGLPMYTPQAMQHIASAALAARPDRCDIEVSAVRAGSHRGEETTSDE